MISGDVYNPCPVIGNYLWVRSGTEFRLFQEVQLVGIIKSKVHSFCAREFLFFCPRKAVPKRLARGRGRIGGKTIL